MSPITQAIETAFSRVTPEDYLNLTKREYFAGLALQGLLAAGKDHNKGAAHVANIAVEIADNLIAQLNK